MRNNSTIVKLRVVSRALVEDGYDFAVALESREAELVRRDKNDRDVLGRLPPPADPLLLLRSLRCLADVDALRDTGTTPLASPVLIVLELEPRRRRNCFRPVSARLKLCAFAACVAAAVATRSITEYSVTKSLLVAADDVTGVRSLMLSLLVLERSISA